ncbi:MAG: aromatic/alkene monooxygenase hydroxylase subunit beta [Steroidobacteraceae bacterium]
MQIDLKTVSIKPLRQTFDHIARRFGDKPASRYQEGTYDIQQTTIFHYRPFWDPERELFDAKRTQITMKDWYAFKDPRQYYYGAYTIARSRQQDAAESNFDMIEERGLTGMIPDDLRRIALEVLVPMRHVEWAGNMNNTYITAYGYGTAITQPCCYAAMDHLGVAQYLTRVGLELGEPSVLDAAKHAWLEAPVWQELRRYVENSFVIKDWFELFVAQNLVLNGIVHPMLYDHLDTEFSTRGGTAISMMTRFMGEWYVETAKWVDSQIKVAIGESPENAALVNGWFRQYRDQLIPAVTPIARHAFGEKADAVLGDIVEQFNTRCRKLGLAV